MKIPDEITVQVVFESEFFPVTGAVLSLRLIMPQKNHYDIGPQFTDEMGFAAFTKKQITKELEICQNVSPMDYCGTIEDCSSLQLALLGKDDIRRLVKARKLWGQGVPEWNLDEHALTTLDSAQRNSIFKKSHSVVMDELKLHQMIVLSISTAHDISVYYELHPIKH